MENNKLLETIVTHLLDIKESQKRLETRVGDIESSASRIETKNDENFSELSTELSNVSQSVTRMENELTDKVRALFDAREVQGDVNDQILNSLSSIQTDINYLVAKSAQQGNELNRLKKTKKIATSL